MKKLSLLVLALFISSNLFATISLKIQNEDVKSLSEITAAGGAASQLINDSKIYVTGLTLNEQLSSAITNGDIFSLKAQGSSALKGLVTLIPGTNITLNQSGQNITINASAGSGGNGSTDWTMTGGVTIGYMDGPDVAEASKSITSVVCSMRNSGTAGSTIVTFNYGPALASSFTLTITANSGLNYNTSTPGVSLTTGDYIDAQVTQVSDGAPEDLRCRVMY